MKARPIATRGLPPAHALVIAALGWFFATGCKDDAPADAPVRRRVDAVAAKPQPKTDLAGFCDTRAEGEDAKTFRMPPLAEGEGNGAQGWRWINVWATWCKPCVEELPMLDGWRSKLTEDKIPVSIVFVSVDDTAEELQSFRKEHPAIPDSLRIRDREVEMGPWLQEIGLGESTALPIHLFVDPEDKIRCVRLGQVSDRDYDNVAALIREG